VTLTFGEVCAGIGGLTLGLQRAGLQPRWFSEVDPFCRSVLAHHWPTVPTFGDMTKLDPADLPPVDLLCGGIPCQPHSQTGKRKGAADERNLWPDFARLICGLKPRWILVENVPGILSTDHGGFFAGVLRDLAALGYDAEWDCLPASAFGAYHERLRLFLVAYPAGLYRDPWGVLEASEERRVSLQSRRLHSVAVAGRGKRPRERLECEPGLARLVRWLPDRTQRLDALGNAVYPAAAEYVGRRILQFNHERSTEDA
jgi:DNA (cytosine-5)-methyltransferase 1